MPQAVQPMLVTGANGHLGRALLEASGAGDAVRAVVRSERAAGALRALALPARPRIVVMDPADADALARAGEGCAGWVHLVGLLKATRHARYEDAHEGLADAVARAAEKAGAARLVYLSILGASPSSENACLASKGRAEARLLAGAVPCTVLRVPMVLGPGEQGAVALRREAHAPLLFLVRGGATKEQPIATHDVVQAIRLALADASREHRALDLAGPESLPHRALLARVAARYGTRPRVVPVPRALVFAVAGLLERFAEEPPVTRAMLGVLEHDDDIDPRPAAEQLGLALTPLDETIRLAFPDARGGAA
jgi:NADH dehydrogenase